MHGRTRHMIRVPASSANLGCAYDAVGLALRLYLHVEVERLATGPSRLDFSGKDADKVPSGGSNLIWRTMAEIAGNSGVELPPFRLTIRNEIPITKGLGSSAAAILAATAAADILCGLNLGRDRILEIATACEGHPDNVTTQLLGGLVASIPAGRLWCSRSEFPPAWTVVAVTPECELETKRARSVLPADIPHRDAVFNVQRAAFLMAQLIQARPEGIREAMRDRLHQDYRCSLVPGLGEILDLPDLDGLLGIALSGAGSTVVALAESHEAEIGEEIRRIFERHGLGSEVRLLKADNDGMIVRRMD